MATRRVRALFFRPGEAEWASSVWVDVDAAEGTVTLQHDYGADLSPGPGWEVAAGGARYEVRSVAGRVLTVTAIGGAA